MSPLSKAFVVLATLLSVVMVALTIGFAAQTENYRASYEEAEIDRQVANAAFARKMAEKDSERQAAVDALSTRESADNSVAAAIEAKTSEIRSLTERIANLEATNARTTAALAATSETLQAANARSASQDEQIRGMIGDMAALARQKSEAEQAIVTATGRSDRLENDVRRLQEQLIALEQENAELTSVNDEMARFLESQNLNPDDVAGGNSGIRIAGAVTNVDQIGDGLTLVEINVGTRDGVQADMPFTIFRGDQYVGTIIIKTVDTDRAVGEVDLAEDTIRSGDDVKTGR